jgi:adenylate kinase family enzyme
VRRILILGSAGSGKSTLARQLGEILGLEVIHLDRYWWQEGWRPAPWERWFEQVLEFLEKDSWIMDGNYLRTLHLRLEAADTVIFLDFPRPLCLWRVVKRRFKYRGKTRSDLAPGCPEKLDWEFLKWIWRFPKVNKPWIMKLLELEGDDRQVFILKGPKRVEEFVEKISSYSRKLQ